MIKEEYKVLYNLEGEYWWFLGRTKIAFSVLKRHLKDRNPKAGNLKILDAGCGTGKNIEYLQKYGAVYGADISQEALQFCRKRSLKNVIKSNIENLPYKDNTFDLVTCFGVLYHKGVGDDLKAIQELQRVCKPNGFVLITTPAGEFLTRKLFVSQHDKSQFTGRRHSRKGLVKLLRKSGLRPIETTHMNTILMPAVVIVRVAKNVKNFFFGQSRKFKSELQMPSKFVNRLLLNILLFENRLIRKMSLPFGLTLVSLSKKNEFTSSRI